MQILPAVPRRSVSGDFGKALGSALSSGLEAYQSQEKKKRLGAALKGVEDIYSDPELSQEQKFIKSFSQLQEFPEVAKQFTSGLSQFSESPLQKAQRKKLKHETRQLKDEESYLSSLMSEGQEEGEPSGKPKFDYKDPETWSDKQINKFRSIEGKTSKAKTLSRTAQNEYDRRQEAKKATVNYQEKVSPFEGALETIGEMEKLGSKGNLGIGTKARGAIYPKARRDAAEYERLGKSLIAYASNIPIRNRAEFETLAEDLYDPSISDDARAGILSAMKKIINNSMKNFATPKEEGGPQARKPEQKERRPLTVFVR